MSKLYGGIDLHANNNVIVLLNEQDQVVSRTRLPNDLEKILVYLDPMYFIQGDPKVTAWLSDWPVKRPGDWVARVNQLE